MATPQMTVNPYAPPRAAVKDVGDPALTRDPADRGTRLGASILDTVIVGVMVYTPLLVTIVAAPLAARASAGGSAGAVLTIGVVLALIGLVTWAVLTIKYVRANGQSIGKKMLGIRVVRSDGSSVSLGRIFWLRNLLNTVIALVPLYGLVDVLFIFSESRQCLHDRIADTIVVNA